jgi:hypothetical protein
MLAPSPAVSRLPRGNPSPIELFPPRLVLPGQRAISPYNIYEHSLQILIDGTVAPWRRAEERRLYRRMRTIAAVHAASAQPAGRRPLSSLIIQSRPRRNTAGPLELALRDFLRISGVVGPIRLRRADLVGRLDEDKGRSNSGLKGLVVRHPSSTTLRHSPATSLHSLR